MQLHLNLTVFNLNNSFFYYNNCFQNTEAITSEAELIPVKLDLLKNESSFDTEQFSSSPENVSLSIKTCIY